MTHRLMSWREHLELAPTHCWDGSLRLGHSDVCLIRDARTAWQSIKKGLESLGRGTVRLGFLCENRVLIHSRFLSRARRTCPSLRYQEIKILVSTCIFEKLTVVTIA